MLSGRLKEVWSKLRLDFSKVYLSLAVLWFSIRVIPKPSRAAYPCQRATVGLISVKLAIVFSSLLVSTTSLFSRKSVKTLSVLALVGVVAWDPLIVAYYQYNFAISRSQLLTLDSVTYGFPSHRIIRVHSNYASNWDFTTASKYWENINQTAVDLMVERGVVELTGTSDPVAAWTSIMQGYTAGHKVGIKINGNDWWYGDHDGVEIDSIPQLTNAIIRGIKSIGVPENDIHVIENTYPTSLGRRIIPLYYTNIVTAKYPNVVFVYANQTSPTYGNVAGTTVTTPQGSYRINDQIARMDHLILVPIMKAITPRWGITGAIKLMQGVIENVDQFHGASGSGLDDTSANNPNVLMYQNPHIIGKTRLIIGDGLFGTWTGVHFGESGPYAPWQDTGVERNDVPKRWLTFNNGAPNLLFFGVDPVAMDSVMLDHVNRERAEQDKSETVSTRPLPEPQLIAGEAAGLGVREHGPPYTDINYVEVELGGATSPTHDIIIVSVQASPVTVLPGEAVSVTVNVRNGGTQSESFTLSAYANTTLIGSKNMLLAAGATAQETVSWDTTGALGIYTIKAEASVVSGEVNTGNNSRNFNGAVAVFTHLVDFPVASFIYSPSDPKADDIVTFNAASSTDPDGNIVSYVWDFGDGGTGQGVSATHTYSAMGDYTVTLRVTDNDELFDSETKDLSVGEKQVQPLLSAELLLLVVGIAVAVIGLTIVLFRKRAG